MYNEGIFTKDAGAALGAARLVKLSSGDVVHNTVTSTDRPIGITQYEVALGDPVAVKALNYPGGQEITAAGAFSEGAEVYAAADGKVSALPAGAGDYLLVGQALEEATADGDIVHFLPYSTPTITTVT